MKWLLIVFYGCVLDSSNGAQLNRSTYTITFCKSEGIWTQGTMFPCSLILKLPGCQQNQKIKNTLCTTEIQTFTIDSALK